jgi:histidinol dehydrogenase
MPAGPSEVCVIADEKANAEFVAADLLSQAEHGADSQVVLITTSNKLIDDVQQEISRQLDRLPRKEIAEKALQNSRIILVNDSKEAMDLSNAYAPEHLVIQTEDYEAMAERVA